MERKKVVLISLIVIFLAITAMAISLYINGKDLSCDKCNVEFSTYKRHGVALGTPYVIDIKINELYSELVDNNHCMIEWSKMDGFYQN